MSAIHAASASPEQHQHQHPSTVGHFLFPHPPMATPQNRFEFPAKMNSMGKAANSPLTPSSSPSSHYSSSSPSSSSSSSDGNGDSQSVTAAAADWQQPNRPEVCEKRDA